MTYTDIRSTALGGADYQTTGSTTLNGGITNSDLTITVASTASFKSGQGILLIDSELITYTGTTGTTFTGCVRGTNGTAAASHSNGATVTEKEIVKSAEINATFDEVATKIKSLSAFWLNTYLYDMYDDFESYSLGTFTSNSKWTITTSTSGTTDVAQANIVASTYAGGSGQELQLRARAYGDGPEGLSASVIAKTLLNGANKHVRFKLMPRVYSTSTSADNTTLYGISVKIEGQSYSDQMPVLTPAQTNVSLDASCNTEVVVMAKGSDYYDVYLGGKKIFSNVNTATPYIYFKVAVSISDNNLPTRWFEVQLYIDDVTTSQSEIS